MFPGGEIPVRISWAALGPLPFVLVPIEINKRLSPGEEFAYTHKETPLASGYTLFTVTKNDFPAIDQSGIVRLQLRDDRKLISGMLFHAVRAKSFEETYTFWALIISAFSLFIIALEKITGFARVPPRLLEPTFLIVLGVFLSLFCYIVVVYLDREPIKRKREGVPSPQREEVEDRFRRIDRLYDVILVLVTVLAAAELQYASVAFMENPDPARTFVMKLNSLSFTFRILTIPIVFLIFIWLGKKFTRDENVGMFIRELGWIFAIYFFQLELIVGWVLSFATINLLWFLIAASIPLVILVGFIMREYRRLAPDLEYLNWRGLMFWTGSTVGVAISWIAIQIVIIIARMLSTPIPL